MAHALSSSLAQFSLLSYKYLQHIPREGRFYRKPLVNKSSDKNIRFSVQSIEINTLSNRMKDLFQAAGIPLENRNITNHVSHAVIVGFGGCSA
jgi:hypothetical protein